MGTAIVRKGIASCRVYRAVRARTKFAEVARRCRRNQRVALVHPRSSNEGTGTLNTDGTRSRRHSSGPEEECLSLVLVVVTRNKYQGHRPCSQSHFSCRGGTFGKKVFRALKSIVAENELSRMRHRGNGLPCTDLVSTSTTCQNHSCRTGPRN